MTWAATQWVAFRLGFQPQLGTPWFELVGLPVYYPPAFFWWWFSFDAYALLVEAGRKSCAIGTCKNARKLSAI
jgi:type IV secretion system protein VirD4